MTVPRAAAVRALDAPCHHRAIPGAEAGRVLDCTCTQVCGRRRQLSMCSLCSLLARASAVSLAMPEAACAGGSAWRGVATSGTLPDAEVWRTGAEACCASDAAVAGAPDFAAGGYSPEPKAGAANITSARLVVATVPRTLRVEGELADITASYWAACARPLTGLPPTRDDKLLARQKLRTALHLARQ